jgi:hypothetical protein
MYFQGLWFPEAAFTPPMSVRVFSSFHAKTRWKDFMAIYKQPELACMRFFSYADRFLSPIASTQFSGKP